eukprot:TRINITY_DN10711_c0_g1_i1.p1 TRINITY_DN10711_c0_g1~~TRINITY_DN10711_c0_g1_i1.p1  ORF type:complete len:150 (-),score=72.25 TRINITY_DN10711_c0_g1_i1:54-479(-)
MSTPVRTYSRKRFLNVSPVIIESKSKSFTNINKENVENLNDDDLASSQENEEKWDKTSNLSFEMEIPMGSIEEEDDFFSFSKSKKNHNAKKKKLEEIKEETKKETKKPANQSKRISPNSNKNKGKSVSYNSKRSSSQEIVE